MTGKTTYTHPFSSLRWHRLPVTLLNIRSLPGMSAHPVSVFQAIIKGVSLSIGDSSEPHVIFHIRNRKHTFRIRESDKISLELFFFRKNTEYINRWQQAFRDYLSGPVTGRNFDVVEIGEPEERSFDMLAEETGIINAEAEVCMEFLTPIPFKKAKDKHRTYITKDSFINLFEKRFSRLFGRDVVYAPGDDDFSLLPYYWSYTEIRHPSISQPGNTQYINGCAGKLYMKGSFENFLPFKILGSELHTGAKLSNSQGYYLLHKEPPGYFKKFFPFFALFYFQH